MSPTNAELPKIATKSYLDLHKVYLALRSPKILEETSHCSLNLLKEPIITEKRDGVRKNICHANLVRKPTLQVKKWVQQLKKGVDADTTPFENDHFSSLTGHNLCAPRMQQLGLVSQSTSEGDYVELADESESDTAYLSSSHLALLVDEKTSVAVGFCSFGIEWSAKATVTRPSDIQLRIDVLEVWIAPEFRKHFRSRLLAACLSRAIVESLQKVESALGDSALEPIAVNVLFSSDIPSPAGAQFLSTCLRELKETMDFIELQEQLLQLRINQLATEPCW
jgi:hypothetical protein